jgi:hypothetical protein
MRIFGAGGKAHDRSRRKKRGKEQTRRRKRRFANHKICTLRLIARAG